MIMGFFSNPLKAHKKIAKAGISATKSLNNAGVSATKSVAKAGIPKQSPARGLLGGGGGGGNTGIVPPGMRTGGPAQATPMGAPSARVQRGPMERRPTGPRPLMAEGGKVKGKKK
jgi:hypothetical protein